MTGFKIGEVEVGLDCKPYFIAEIGSNFDGSIHRARDLIYMAKEAGAHAAKFQHYTASTLVSDSGFKGLKGVSTHQKSWKNSVYEVYDKASLNKEWTSELVDACNNVGIHFLTSPYSLDLVDYVDQYVPGFKIGSGDITWHNIIDAMAKKGKPILLATGASDLADVTRAMGIILKHTTEIAIMQCNTNYTVDNVNNMYQNIRVLNTYKSLYPDAVLGLSDHTKGDLSVLAAYSLGARVFEKHFTDDCTRHGPDHAFALTPREFSAMVGKLDELECILGSGVKKVEHNELDTNVVQRRAIHINRSMKAGELLKLSDFDYLRPCPADAFPPYMDQIIANKKVLKVDLEAGSCLKKADLSN